MASEKDATAEIIQHALAQEEEEKKQRKAEKEGAKRAAKQSQKAASFPDQEAEDAGPIKESLVDVAHTKRAAKRKGGGVGDTDLVRDLQRVEEDLEVEEEGGMKLEAFNLKEEREKGYFDEEGNYVAREEKEEDEEADAWLESEEAKVVDVRTLQRIKERQRQEAEAEAAAPLTAVQIARLQWQVAQLLRPGETVAAGLRRLGGGQRGRPAKRAKRAPHSASATASGANEAERNPQDKEWFDQLTEAASALVDVGESDVYDKDREYFKRAASVYIDVDDDEDQGGGGNAGQGSLGGEGLLRQSKAAYEDADEDMFASDGEGQGNGDAGAAAERQTEKNQQEAVAGVNALQSAARGPEDATDYGNWPVKELRRFLQERGVDTGGIVEKPELVAKVKEVAATQSASREAASAPPGYAFDSGSGMYWSAESGMYWDAASKGFYNPADSKWYSYSGGQWVEWGALT